LYELRPAATDGCGTVERFGEIVRVKDSSEHILAVNVAVTQPAVARMPVHGSAMKIPPRIAVPEATLLQKTTWPIPRRL
jgi:hypothetical protein